jgi:RNA polymerase sigma factor (sigma-70 family)
MAGADMTATVRSQLDAVFCDLLARLYRRAVLLAGEASAEDAVHEAYLKLAARPHRLITHPQPYAYALATVVSVVRDEWRRGRRQLLATEIGEQAHTAVDGGLAWREAVWEARCMLDGLPRKEAAAVLLVDLDGYTIDQAADVLGVHRGTVARARCRALDKLRRREQSRLTEGIGERPRRRARGQ